MYIYISSPEYTCDIVQTEQVVYIKKRCHKFGREQGELYWRAQKAETKRGNDVIIREIREIVKSNQTTQS